MKRIIIQSNDLKPALSKLGQVISTRATQPVLQNILCRVTPGQLELIGTNTETTIYYRLACEAPEAGEFLLPYDFIHELIALKKNTPLEIEAFKTKVVVSDEAGSYDAKPYGKLEELPKLQELPKKLMIEIDKAVFESMKTAVTTIGNGKIAGKGLTYVLLELTDKKMVVASSDGSYMVYSHEFTSAQTENESLLINPKVIKLLEGEQDLKLSYHSKAIGFTSDRITIVSTRSEEKYVNFRKIFPEAWPGNLKVNRNDLVEALNICSLANDDLNSTLFTLTKDGVKLSANNSSRNVKYGIKSTYTGSVESVVLNSEKFLRLLSQLDQEEIELALHEPTKPIVITCNENEGYKGLIMPIAQKK